MPDLTHLTDKELQNSLRSARASLSDAKTAHAHNHAACAQSRAVVTAAQQYHSVLAAERDRRNEERYEELHKSMKRERTFESQLGEIMSTINHYCPKDLHGDIPASVKRILERVYGANGSTDQTATAMNQS